MNQLLEQHLRSQGARIESGDVLDFGAPKDELATAMHATVAVPISDAGLVRATGADATTFLHSLLTNDVSKLSDGRAQYNGFCSAKGRLLASFLMWRDGDDILLQVSRDIRGGMLKKLGMYVLRSKVKLTDVSGDFSLIGVAGANAGAVSEMLRIPAAANDMDVVRSEHGFLIRLDVDRFQLCIAGESGPRIWDQISEVARPAGMAVWRWLEIEAGVPWITAMTQEEFVPQMVNFDLIGGISFHKGCYPGQEVVARTQYLGRLKRRMVLAHLDSELAPAGGAPLYSPDLPDQSCGMVVNASPAPGGGHDLLAVIQTSSAEGNAIHLARPDGPRIELRRLPYDVT